MQVNVPDHWTDTTITNTALRLLDVIHVLGPYVRFNEWRARFKSGTSKEGAMRGWERWKAELREIEGCEFTISRDFEEADAVYSVVFESTAHAMAIVEALIGPADLICWEPNPKANTLSVYDLLPDCSDEEITEFLDVLTEDLTTHDKEIRHGT